MSTPAPMTFWQAVTLVRHARVAADLFPGVGSTGLTLADKRLYRQLARVLHPDAAGPGLAGVAHEAFTRLTGLVANLDETTPAGRGRVRVGSLRATGEIASIFDVSWTPTTAAGVGGGLGSGTTSAAVWKLAHSPRDNDLLDAEAAALTRLARDGDARFAPYVPRLLDVLTHRDEASGIERHGSVLGALDGFVSLDAVATAYPGGLDPRDAAWIWRRLLVALGFAHRAGVVHTAVLPEHVLIEPDVHGLVLIDWCYSTLAPAPSQAYPPASAMVSARSDFYAPEIAQRRPVSEGSDLFMATRTMTALVGPRLPPSMRDLARRCLAPDVKARPSDAWAVLHDLDGVLGSLYGPRRFRAFGWPPR